VAIEHTDAFSKRHSDDMQQAEEVECVLRAATGLLELDPKMPILCIFSVSTSAQKLCEHFQKCAISPVEDRSESS